MLGAILLSNTAYAKASKHVTAEDFYRVAHRLIYAAMSALLEPAGGACDFVTLREALTRKGELDEAGGPVYLAGLTDGVPKSTNVEHYARVVRDKADARRIIFAASKVMAAAYDQEAAPAEVLAQADAAFMALQQGRRGDAEPISLAGSMPRLIENLEWRVAHKGQLSGLETGFRSVNDLTGGWQRGDLIILAARPSIGKTAYMLNTAMAAAETGARTLVFSMEMAAQQLEYRWLSSLSGVPAMHFMTGYLGPQTSEEWPRIHAALERMHAAPIYIDDQPARTVADVRAMARLVSSQGGLDLIVIDYVQLMPGSLEKRNATRTEELAHISRSLKRLAGEMRVPIILVSQLRRIIGRPKLDDLRESGSLEQDADVVAFLHRKSHREEGTTEMIVEKQRNGPTGTLLLTFHKQTLTFADGGEPPSESADEEEAAAEKQRQRVRRAGYAIRKSR